MSAQRENTTPDAASQPDVSIIVACYNAAATVATTLNSLLSQTHANWEAICVDDGSTDGTLDRLREFGDADARFRIEPRPHAGQPATKNAGFDRAHGRYVMVLDADDIARPDAIATMLRFAEAAGGDAIVTPGYELLTAGGSPIGVYRFPSTFAYRVDTLLRGNRLAPMSLIPRHALADHRFDDEPTTSIDWNLWLKLANAGVRCVPAPCVLFGYRLHVGSLSHNADRLYRSGRQVLERWLPHADNPDALRDVHHRLAATYGALSLAFGDEGGLRRYFSTLPPLHASEDFDNVVAGALYWAFEFVHGAEGHTWRTHRGQWRRAALSWLMNGPLMNRSVEIRTALERQILAGSSTLQAVERVLHEAPPRRRIVVYGMGTNGLTLLARLRDDSRSHSRKLYVADDRAERSTLASHGLPIEDPRNWTEWPDDTLVVITPSAYTAMQTRLEALGGIAGVDFLALGSEIKPSRSESRTHVEAPLPAAAR